MIDVEHDKSRFFATVYIDPCTFYLQWTAPSLSTCCLNHLFSSLCIDKLVIIRLVFSDLYYSVNSVHIKVFSNHYDIMKFFHKFEINIDLTLSCRNTYNLYYFRTYSVAIVYHVENMVRNQIQ